jgi:hypothetical protein
MGLAVRVPKFSFDFRTQLQRQPKAWKKPQVSGLFRVLSTVQVTYRSPGDLRRQPVLRIFTR